MEERIQELHRLILEMFPDAVAVRVLVNSQGIKVEPEFRANPDGYSMRTITGRWLAKGKSKEV